jgi:hypothetical protein
MRLRSHQHDLVIWSSPARPASAPARVKVTTTAGAIDVTVPGGTSYKVTTSSTVVCRDPGRRPPVGAALASAA